MRWKPIKFINFKSHSTLPSHTDTKTLSAELCIIIIKDIYNNNDDGRIQCRTSFILQPQNGKQTDFCIDQYVSVVQRLDSTDSTMHVIYWYVSFGHLSIRAQHQCAKLTRKKKTKFQSAFKEERRKHTKNFHFYLFTSRFVCYYASCSGAAISFSLYFSLSFVVIEAHTQHTHVCDFMIQTTSAAVAIVCQTLVLRWTSMWRKVVCAMTCDVWRCRRKANPQNRSKKFKTTE